ncbi:PilZ domain-containing protein [Anaerobacillus alkaliphilus]|uniref:PilZ domain-containing protein n=1 Tax=Anaerobacillus alkaliphilus TaxID=1548597 RepID=A0A4Q0VN03_9BACI|nr:PilZ domain-containing protein [Anaerobacillus alkaliphilus]RXI96424.1 PilZ domain-containing protein [Anaerobacillus alkaliphilus]
MRYRRQDTFRYRFEEPIACTFKIIRVGEQEFNSKLGSAQIDDISDGGLKLSTSFTLPVTHRNIEIEITFKLNEEEIKLTGNVLWVKNSSYGVQFTIDDSSRKQLIEELKLYSRGVVFIRRQK